MAKKLSRMDENRHFERFLLRFYALLSDSCGFDSRRERHHIKKPLSARGFFIASNDFEKQKQELELKRVRRGKACGTIFGLFFSYNILFSIQVSI